VSKIRNAALSFLLLLTLAAPGLAADNEYTREGGYLGMGGFFALENTKGKFAGSDNTGGLTFIAGYRMVPAVAFEVEGSWVQGFTETPPGTNRAIGNLVANIKLYLWESFDRALMEGRLQPYLIGHFGISMANLTAGTAVNAQLGGGAGVEYYLNRNWVVNSYIQYNDAKRQLGGADYTSFMLGASYRW
jgi:hypothetical protein